MISSEVSKEENLEETIVLDMKVINEALMKNKVYNNKNIIFKYDLRQGEEPGVLKDEHKYMVSITNEKFSYIGALNSKIERSIIGRNQYHNGDVYLGFWKNNKKDKYGIYMHKPEDGEVEVYHGFWENGVKSKYGIYVWKANIEEHERIDVDAFIGLFHEGKFSKGLFLSHNQDERNTTNLHFYFGKFSEEGKKNDDFGFYYLAHLGQLFYGKIVDDVLIEGYITKVTNIESNLIDTPFHFEKSETGKILIQDINDQSKIEELSNIFHSFLQTLIREDFVKSTLAHYDLCCNEIQNYNLFEKFESEVGFSKDLKNLTKYSELTSKLKPFFNLTAEE